MKKKRLCGEFWRHDMAMTDAGYKACSRCGALARHGVPPAVRFWSHVDITDRTGCWLWTGAVSARGYGVFQATVPKKVNTCATKVAWYFTYNQWPDDRYEMCHRCDNTLCVRPDHLFLGTHLENIRDMVRKGRKVTKMTPAMVRVARERWRAGESVRALAEDYGIEKSTMGRTLRGLVWSSVV